ncbi:unnamed protein product [Mytilus coruscus]|uniref:C2H2-type domain-containing protein n=1 Tax=Mytilus coruscus TaxID=42192 RepID=A0A6J8DV05_MYTCO|nr:unnamed protein product [Mytilus coruscus]
MSQKYPSLSDFTITDANSLIVWAIENRLLTNQLVIDRLTYLQTCKHCGIKIDLPSKLREHQTVHESVNNQIVSYPPQTSRQNPNISILKASRTPEVQTKQTNHLGESSQRGYGATDESLPYIFEKTGEKTFSKNLAKEMTYKIKFNDQWKGKKIRDILKEVRGMFDDVLNRARGNNESDLGRVIVTRPDLNNATVVPLDKWSNIDSKRVMTAVENVLNSEEKIYL